jgi:hypothetical protein
VDPDPDPYSESGSRRAKITHKSRKKLSNFIFEVPFKELNASFVTWRSFIEA